MRLVDRVIGGFSSRLQSRIDQILHNNRGHKAVRIVIESRSGYGLRAVYVTVGKLFVCLRLLPAAGVIRVFSYGFASAICNFCYFVRKVGISIFE